MPFNNVKTHTHTFIYDINTRIFVLACVCVCCYSLGPNTYAFNVVCTMYNNIITKYTQYIIRSKRAAVCLGISRSRLRERERERPSAPCTHNTTQLWRLRNSRGLLNFCRGSRARHIILLFYHRHIIHIYTHTRTHVVLYLYTLYDIAIWVYYVPTYTHLHSIILNARVIKTYSGEIDRGNARLE